MAVLNFKGKTFVQNHHLAVKYHQLVPKKDKSLTDKVRLNDNLIIHGDNLKALKALLPTYAGKVKCIYIDPPYNTGNEKWVYNDNVNSPMMQEWLGKVVDREDLTRHDKWLCMMMPRLKLLRELLKEDGAIFVSIDDNEVHHLRMLMDEVFGEENFIANFIWKKKGTTTSTASEVSTLTEFVICYGKFDTKLQKRKLEKIEYPEDDNDNRGKYRLVGIETSNYGQYERPTMLFPILGVRPRSGKRWKIGESKTRQLLNENKLKVVNGVVYKKVYEVEEQRIGVYNNMIDGFGSSQSARKEFNIDIMNKPEQFETPKPVELVKYLINIACDDGIILDSFAGSGTTAHAVLDLNKEDGGNRKFILVECEDYADKITAERVRRVIKGYSKRPSLRATEGSAAISGIASPELAPECLKRGARNDNEGLGGSFSFFELGDPIEMESILEGKKLPSYTDLARYVFYTATGEEFEPKKVNEKKNFIGESRECEVYLFYKPDIEYLKTTALTLDTAKKLGEYKGKKRLVFAPSKYLDTDYLLEYRIDYCQLPFEIYRLKG